MAATQDKNGYLAFVFPVTDVPSNPGSLLPTYYASGQDASGAHSDDRLIELWLAGRSPNTRRAYECDVRRFLAHVAKPLRIVTVADLQSFVDSLEGAPSTRARRISAVKSLLAFGHRVGYLAFDIGRPVRQPKQKDKLAERILSEADVHRMIALEPSRRNRTALTTLYGAGLRAAELCGLRWRDVIPRDQTGQLAIFGKGGKTRFVLVSATTWIAIVALRPTDADPDDFVFRSRKGGPLDTSALHRIVRASARRAGLPGNVSPHWLRHSHATHALERGAPVHLVASTLGHASIAVTSRYLHARPSESSARFLSV